MNAILILAVHTTLALVAPPLLLGLIQRTKAKLAGRTGAPLLQPYWDLIKLARKGSVFSLTTTSLFKLAPALTLAATGVAGLLMPLAGRAAPLAFSGDVLLFAYLFGLGRLFTVLAALDTGSSFEGMGAAREVTFSAFAEPALFLCLVVLARLVGGELSLSVFLGDALPGLWTTSAAPLVLVAVALFIVLLAENCRIPFDDPTTHLELTMIHEVMVLDHSGPGLGLALYGAALKLWVQGGLLVGLVCPFSGVSWPLALAGYLAAMLGLAVAIGVVESVMARLRLSQVPTLLVAACVVAGFGVVLVR